MTHFSKNNDNDNDNNTVVYNVHNVQNAQKTVDKNNPTHYVNNKEFTKAVIAHNQQRKQCIIDGIPVPTIPDYVGICIMKIAEGMSNKYQFCRYTWKEEMIGDAIENCIRYLHNFDPSKATNTKEPNAFGYFSQIVYFAFVRRIMKENHQGNVKDRIISRTESLSEDLFYTENDFERGDYRGKLQSQEVNVQGGYGNYY